jgi:hypothetical protein
MRIEATTPSTTTYEALAKPGPAPASGQRPGRADSAPPGANHRWIDALRAAGRPTDAHDPRQAERAAADLLSQLFFVPLLAEMRAFSIGGRFANGGRAEAVFGEQLDLRVADSVARSDPGGMVSQLAARLRPAASDSERGAASSPPRSQPDIPRSEEPGAHT